VLDIDYLVDTVFKKTFPLDLMGLRSSKVEVVVPAVTYESGEVAYFSSKDASLDWFEVLRAAKALPLVYNKKIKIGDKHYFDTPASSSWSLHIEKALAMGATHFLIVDLNQYYKSKQMTKLMGYLIKKYTFKNSENSYNSEPIFRDDFTVSNDFHHYVRPNRFIGNLDARVESLRMMWEDGYAYGVKDEGLKNFLEQF
jgi:predicted patatin/cPLA2 family phospholipase